MLNIWSYVNKGSPDNFAVDRNTEYTSKKMKDPLEAHGLQLGETLIERPGAIETAERYHASLRLVYGGIWADT